MRHTFLVTILLITSLALGACASMPAELAAGGPYLQIAPAQAQGGEYEQQRVRWGGSLIQTLPQGQRTCFEVAGLSLDKWGEPLESDISTGRFTACAEGFYEPAIYSPGRHVTFTGRIQGRATQQISERRFEFPKLEADRVYLWPKRSEMIYVPYSTYWHPYGDPYYWNYPRWP
ncbi:Slp/YeaY family lipoprotein [Sulfuriflexus sp.]|uniref:Slp family lipoprotein n=1 Tax=Sulfuriflexus sp. TaxID=2015443 RepID=UPI0028CD8203|nr:Slp/YeaY family lipoprotein [Sulfuriflexus sp.]MDT8404777.1 Slp/YeaY family lipoprotein [Sulfuriflexus sp.]